MIGMPQNYEEAVAFIEEYNKFPTQITYANHYKQRQNSVSARVKKARELIKERESILVNVSVDEKPTVTHVQLDPDFDAKDFVANMKKRFEVKKKNKDLSHWQPMKINNSKVSIIPFIGDPHLDDDGCDWVTLEQHMNIIAKLQSEGHNCFPVCMGDILNNWVKSGRLVKKWADQTVTQSKSYKLAKYFIRDMGVKFALYIIGNHDKWNEFVYLLEEYCDYVGLPMADWRCRFKFVFKNGYEFKVDAAHDHKGNSMYNKTHAQDRAVMFAGIKPDLILSAHRHTYSLKHDFEPDVGFIWKGRMSGYKVIDEYADFLQYDNQGVGHSIWAVIDPENKTSECFDSPEKAIAYYNGLMLARNGKVFK